MGGAPRTHTQENLSSIPPYLLINVQPQALGMFSVIPVQELVIALGPLKKTVIEGNDPCLVVDRKEN